MRRNLQGLRTPLLLLAVWLVGLSACESPTGSELKGDLTPPEDTADVSLLDIDLQDGITVGNFKSCISRWMDQSDMALSAVLSGGGSSGGDGEVITDLDMEMVVEAFAELGFEATEDEDGDLTFAKDEIIYNFIRFDEGDFMIQAELTGNTTIEAINDWNAASRFGRAYLSPEDNSVYVELDIDIQGGGTWENVVNQITRFLEETVPDVQNAVFDQGMRRAG